MKTCTKCGISKFLSDFRPQKSGREGVRANCKACDSKLVRERTILRNQGVPKATRRKHGVEPNDPSYRASISMKYSYGITIGQYTQMLKNQNDACAICGDPAQNKRFDIDHDHKTGKVRGLLCNSCNIGLGKFKDSKDLLLNAMSYLTKSD